MNLLIRFWIAALVLASAGSALGDGGVYRSTAHGNTASGVFRDSSLPRGDCSQCHLQHSTPGYNFGLFADNYGGSKNGVCFTCHLDGSVNYLGQSAYTNAVHNTSSFVSWPGLSPAARPSSDFGNCANCHNPHGHADALGSIPSMAVAREENLCLTCHDASGPASDDIQAQITKQYDHYIDNGGFSGLHSAAEGMTPASFSGPNRHVECSDCHNVHRIPSSIKHTPGTNIASDLLKGVSRLEATYGGAPWTAPTFTPRPANYQVDIRYEYELCFKCHTSWAYGSSPPMAPSGSIETDQSVEFNPNNASYHPVVDYIKDNSYTAPTATNGFIQTMEPPWDAISGHKLMYCSDCHSSETESDPLGPHGSTNPFMLIAPTSATDNSLCLKCHKASVYAPLTDPGSSQTGSRFDRLTTDKGNASHYFHVIRQGVGCRECHGGSEAPGGGTVSPGSAHGTNRAAGLMNGAKILSYAPGSCTPTCHGNKTYTAGPE
ncbi:MAG: hypothetical protein HYX78_06165 [Armatimonadetes bacterium]|nr:hypothetical protein [Armatimonadota bacterium]